MSPQFSPMVAFLSTTWKNTPVTPNPTLRFQYCRGMLLSYWLTVRTSNVPPLLQLLASSSTVTTAEVCFPDIIYVNMCRSLRYLTDLRPSAIIMEARLALVRIWQETWNKTELTFVTRKRKNNVEHNASSHSNSSNRGVQSRMLGAEIF